MLPRGACRAGLCEGSEATAKPAQARAPSHSPADSLSPKTPAHAGVTNTCRTQGRRRHVSCGWPDCSAMLGSWTCHGHGGCRSWTTTARSTRTLPWAYATWGNACQPWSSLPPGSLVFTTPATHMHKL